MRRYDANGKKEAGMTLAELLITIAVIAILSSIAVPAINSYLPAYRLSAAANELLSNLQRAKQEAVRVNGECAVYFDAVNGIYYLVGSGPDGLCNGALAGIPPLPQKDDILLNQVTLSNYGSGIHYGSGMATKSVPGKAIPPVPTVSYKNDCVRFDSKGMAREMGYVYLTNINGATFAVGTPSLAGAIVQKKWLGKNWN